jgi:hypothetical protein
LAAETAKVMGLLQAAKLLPYAKATRLISQTLLRKTEAVVFAVEMPPIMRSIVDSSLPLKSATELIIAFYALLDKILASVAVKDLIGDENTGLLGQLQMELAEGSCID